MIDPELLNMIRCPETGCKLIAHPKLNELWCRASKKAYAVKNGVPVLLIKTARALNDTELNWLDNSSL